NLSGTTGRSDDRDVFRRCQPCESISNTGGDRTPLLLPWGQGPFEVDHGIFGRLRLIPESPGDYISKDLLRRELARAFMWHSAAMRTKDQFPRRRTDRSSTVRFFLRRHRRLEKLVCEGIARDLRRVEGVRLKLCCDR